MPLRHALFSALLLVVLAPAVLHAETIQVTGTVSDRGNNDFAYPFGNFNLTFDVAPGDLLLPHILDSDGYYEVFTAKLTNVRVEIDFTSPPYYPPNPPIPTIIETNGTGGISTGGFTTNELGFTAGQISGYFYTPFDYTGNGPVYNDDGFDTAMLTIAPGPQSILPYSETYDLVTTGSTIISADTPEPSSLLLLGTGALASASTLLRRARSQNS